ncbi:MAG TPA: acetylglutamate kinase [Thermoanaerobaculia bacterium]|nr:acetylglutamate kinase [Thermoanaerobaculia bacterium]
MNHHDSNLEVAGLKLAIPYIRLYQGKTFVIKAGGGAFADERTTIALLEQVEILHRLGVRVVLVHGGGPQASALAATLGASVEFKAGRRVTDPVSLDAATMVLNGAVNTQILALCRRVGVPAVGLSGVDAGLIVARRRPPVDVDGETVDYGLVGDVVRVDPKVVLAQLDAGLVPVVSPISADEAGGLLNVNADTIAARLAVALSAEKLIVLTGAAGILEREEDAGSRISYTDLAGLAELNRRGALGAGMRPKAAAIEEALIQGVRRVHVISQTAPDALLREVFTNEGSGTLVVADIHALTPAELAAAG